MKTVSIIITSITFFSFLISVFNVFKKVSDIDIYKQILLKILSVTIWSTIIYYLLNQPPNLLIDFVNAAIQSTLLFLFWNTSSIVKKNQFSIIYSNDLPNKLVQEGLYKKIRHPFYMIYILSYIFSSLATSSTICISLSILMIGVYYNAATLEEKKFAATNLRSDYETYKKTTGLFWPKLS